MVSIPKGMHYTPCVCPAWHDYFEGSHIILWMEVPHGEVDKSR